MPPRIASISRRCASLPALALAAACSGSPADSSSLPDAAMSFAPLPLCINELMPDNRAAWPDEHGTFSDWIELHNPGSAAVSLDGWSLTDDPAAPRESLIPGGESIPPGGFVVLFADHMPALGPHHLGFKLDDDGGAVGLFAPDGRGTVVRYDRIERDFSASRRPDCCEGNGCFEFVFRGSPAKSNVVHTVSSVTALAKGSTWRYLDTGVTPPATWTTAAFNDSAWKSGPAPLGYGDAHIVTTVGYGADANNKYVTTWLRARFPIKGKKELLGAKLSLLRDDGAVVYVNGTEVARSNLPDGALTPATLATAGISGADETAYTDFPFDPALLFDGDNLLAVELHQAAGSSSDLGMDCTVTVDRPDP